MNTISLDKILSVASQAASAAGKLMLQSRTQRDVSISYKGRTDLVTQYDLECENVIVDIIRTHFSDHELLTEETHTTVKSTADYLKPLWIIDPIDGTTNFAHGHYQVATSIGFSLNGVLSVGVVHSPFLNETYTAVRGGGAFRNNQPIKCSEVTDLNHALISTGFPYEKFGKEHIDILMARAKSVLLNCRELRRLGAASLDICWVADGRLDGYYESIKPWDCAAAIVVAREAGAMTGHIAPIPDSFELPRDFYTTGSLFSNPELFPQLQKILANS